VSTVQLLELLNSLLVLYNGVILTHDVVKVTRCNVVNFIATITVYRCSYMCYECIVILMIIGVGAGDEM
jgi:hypothetical protein